MALPNATAAQTVKRRAFTLMEMMVTITIIGVVAVSAAPLFRNEEFLRMMAASSLVISDIELAQVMTMSYPEQPVVVRFEPDRGQYWLAYGYDPETAILRPDTGDPYIVTLGQGRAAGAGGVELLLDQISGNMLEFNAQGGLAQFTARPAIQLSSGPSAVTLLIGPTTGSITEVAGTIEDLDP